MLLKDLISQVEVEYIKPDIPMHITGIAYDSRKVQKGYLFVCRLGYTVDGHDYIPQAIANGAVAVLVEKEVGELSVPVVKVSSSRRALALISAAFFNFPSSKFKLIGVTGTNGKTTTTYMIKKVLEFQNKKVGLIGTNQNMIGHLVIPMETTTPTTPDSYELQQLFSMMAKENVDDVVMEVSSHALELNRVEGSEFDIGIFTNLTQDHLDFHETMENYLRAKAKLFQCCKIGIINLDDPYSQYILQNGTCKMITYGLSKEADIWARDIAFSNTGVQFTVYTPNGQQHMKLAMLGKFSIYNALASIAACIELGISLPQIEEGFMLVKGVPGRAELVNTERDFSVIIDYAHTPDSLQNIISAVKAFAKGRVVTLFGCGGDRDNSKRAIMGRIAGTLSDYCIVTSDNPRTEDPMKIIDQIIEGMQETQCCYTVIENRYDAIKYALVNAQKDDIIILAGKGHETYQEINGKKLPFNEREVVEELLNRDLKW